MGIHPVDIHVGKRLRLRRVSLGISQEALGKMVGVTFQQMQKYEKGSNRISASRLFLLSQILTVSPMYFFEGLTADPAPHARNRQVQEQEDEQALFTRRQSLELMRCYYRLPNDELRKSIYGLIRQLVS